MQQTGAGDPFHSRLTTDDRMQNRTHDVQTAGVLHEHLDLERYPLDQPGRCELLIERCREELAGLGVCSLPAFVRTATIAGAAEELLPLVRERSFFHSRRHNIYFTDTPPGIAADHPALALQETSSRTVCDDQIAWSFVHALYEWPPLRNFLARVMGKPRLHLMEDPLARVNVMGYREGEGLGWHFDRSEFTTTLLIQASQDGGHLEYRPDLAQDDLDGVAGLLEGRDAARCTHVQQAGTLTVFKGRNTAHRVTPVVGETERLIAVFSYFDRPGVVFSAAERLGFYGRAA